MEQQEKEQCVKMVKQATEGKKLRDHVNVIHQWIYLQHYIWNVCYIQNKQKLNLGKSFAFTSCFKRTPGIFCYFN